MEAILLETRLLIAYGLIAVMILGGGLWFATTARRRSARKLRLRGIKSDQRR